ncbi:unnamed protein product [Leptosia nina]|uniref:Uncharacterized protein n=1 Tax=Leptosia nina TaxID=320188 RepID=A0AAV1JRZ0_9NEOP
MRAVRTDDEGTSSGGLLRAATDDGASAYRVDGALTSHCVTTPAPRRAHLAAPSCPARRLPARPTPNLSQPMTTATDRHHFPCLSPYLTVKSSPSRVQKDIYSSIIIVIKTPKHVCYIRYEGENLED